MKREESKSTKRRERKSEKRSKKKKNVAVSKLKPSSHALNSSTKMQTQHWATMMRQLQKVKTRLNLLFAKVTRLVATTHALVVRVKNTNIATAKLPEDRLIENGR